MAVHERTREWISKAIAIHGDLYDYSETEYLSTKDPISFICRIHGEVTIPQAGIHLRKVKPGGCQQCGWEKIRKHGLCKDCGAQTSCKKTVRCESCSHSKKKEIDAKRTRKCKTCGDEYKGDPRSAFCSNICYRSYRDIHDPWINISCVICGADKQIRLKQKSSNNCCSRACSTILLKKNQGHPFGRRTPEERGRANLDRYRKKRSRERKKNSVSYKFWRLCKRQGIRETNNEDPWMKRCRAAVSGLSNRPLSVTNTDKAQNLIDSFQSKEFKKKIQKAFSNAKNKEEEKWKAKSWNAISLLAKRRRVVKK